MIRPSTWYCSARGSACSSSSPWAMFRSRVQYPRACSLAVNSCKQPGVKGIHKTDHHQADHARGVLVQAARNGVGAVAELLRRRHHLLAHLVGDAGARREDPRDGGLGDTREARDLDRGNRGLAAVVRVLSGCHVRLTSSESEVYAENVYVCKNTTSLPFVKSPNSQNDHQFSPRSPAERGRESLLGLLFSVTIGGIQELGYPSCRVRSHC